MKVKKAVILAAGFGTRVLPATKSMPKEMLTIVDKPAIQYIVEEVVASGIEEIMIVLSRGKTIVEDHFDRSPSLEKNLEQSGKLDALETVRNIGNLADITYVRQKEMLGTGNAVMHAKSFVGNEPFVVIYGDDVIVGEDPATRQVCESYEKYGKGVVAMKEVPTELVLKYCTLDVNNIENNQYTISNMIEKPTLEQIISNFAILGRCVLPPEIFEILTKTPKGSGGEYQLTDAMNVLANRDGMIGVDFTGKRYDMGNKLGIMQAIVEVGIKHDEIGEDFRAYLKEIANTI